MKPMQRTGKATQREKIEATRQAREEVLQRYLAEALSQSGPPGRRGSTSKTQF